jgi:hypothetical protein
LIPSRSTTVRGPKPSLADSAIWGNNESRLGCPAAIKENPSQTQIQPNPGVIQQNLAKFSQGKSLDFL